VMGARPRQAVWGRRRLWSSVSDGNSKQFAHTAIVGAHAVPALPGLATTLRSYGPMSALPR
jgi:hypothetical protein